jgi:hypothetical protein
MPQVPAGSVCETEVEFLARAIIAQHGPAAANAAEQHLDQLTQSGSPRCDTWSAVIDMIHAFRCRQANAASPLVW